MKCIYLLVLFFISVNLSNAQSEQLEAIWVLDSIFDYDILLENPSNSYVTIYNNTSLPSRIYIHGICGETYQSRYPNSDSENSIEISQTNWLPNDCAEDTIGWENALYSLFGNSNVEPKILTYVISNNLDAETLELSYTYQEDGISIGTTGYFTKLLPPSELLNNWFLHSITTGNVQHDNYIGEINLEFTDGVSGSQNFFSAGGSTPCEFYGGGYKATSSNSLSFGGFAESASCSSATVDGFYTNKYIGVLSHNYTYSGDIIYEISEENQETQLKLTNTFGDFAVFKTYPPTATLFKTWYSYFTETADGIIYPSPNDTPTLTLTKDGDDVLGYLLNGNGGCNEFDGAHYIYETNQNEFAIYITSQNLVICEDNVYEPTYFSVLGGQTNNPFSYELQDDGNTLILTNTIGDVLTFGSNPTSTELLGVWYLDHIEVDNATYNNNYNDESLFELEITETSGAENSYYFSGYGVCNSFGGTFTINQSDLIFNDLNFTLQDCDPTPSVIFESLYYYSFLNDGQSPINFSFSIAGENDDQVLTITNPTNGNIAVYGRNPNTEILTRTWYLSRIEIPGNPTIEIPNTENPSLTLTTDINPITFRATAFGAGDCNAFVSDYEISSNNGDRIKLLDFSPTLGFCESSYEDEYFITIGDPTNNFSEFEIINNGTTLIVTDLLGARLMFGDEPLSISENEINVSLIYLKNNPVSSDIHLSISPSESRLNYQIYSIDGKLIKKATLNSESINVDDLNSGLYFIRFANEGNQVQTIKFIKQ